VCRRFVSGMDFGSIFTLLLDRSPKKAGVANEDAEAARPAKSDNLHGSNSGLF